MWGVLWVQQGQSFGRPDLPDSALASLSAGLESEVGTVLGGRRARELPQVVEQRLRELVTAAQRRPRGEYKDLLDQIAEKEQHLNEQQQQQRAMSETLVQLTDAEERLNRLDDGDQERIDQKKLSQARVQFGEAMRRESQIEAAHSQLQNLEGRLEQARRAQTERTSRSSELTDAKNKLCQEREGLWKLQKDLRVLSDPLEQLRKEVEKAEAAVRTEEQSEVKWRFTLDVITRTSELRDLLQRQKDVAAAQQRLDDAQSRARQILVTDESLRRIRLAADTANQAAAHLSVSATRISFEVPGDRLAGIGGRRHSACQST